MKTRLILPAVTSIHSIHLSKGAGGHRPRISLKTAPGICQACQPPLSGIIIGKIDSNYYFIFKRTKQLIEFQGKINLLDTLQ